MSKAERDRRLIRGLARQQVAALDRNRVMNPKGDRPRYPNGRLKAPTPNEVVVEHRRRLLGNPSAKGHALRFAENALDLMKERGWLTTGMHQSAADFRRLYLAAFPPMPDVKTTRIDEAPSAERCMDRVAAAIRTPNPDGNPAAMIVLRAIWRVLDRCPPAHRQLVEACIIPGHWPVWLVAMIDKRTLTPPEKAGRAAFFEGLHIIGKVLAMPPSALAA